MNKIKFVQNLDWQRHIRAIAVWLHVGMPICLLPIPLIGIALYNNMPTGRGLAAMGGLVIIIGLLVACFLLACLIGIILGQGLWRFNQTARWIVIGISVLETFYCVLIWLLNLRWLWLVPADFIATFTWLIEIGILITWLVAVIWALYCQAADNVFTRFHGAEFYQVKQHPVPFKTSGFFGAPFPAILIIFLLFFFQSHLSQSYFDLRHLSFYFLLHPTHIISR